MTALDIAAVIYALTIVAFLALILKHDIDPPANQYGQARPYRLPRSAIDLLTAIYVVAWPAFVVSVAWRRWSAKKAARRP